MEEDILLSVALVTRNRPDSLKRTLHSLRAQDMQPYEVIVSDDSDDSHSQETECVALTYDCRYIRGPRRGLYANRNHAASACLGTHIRTMDDDHEFPGGHIRECCSAISRDSTAVWIIGEYQPGEDMALPPSVPGQLHPSGFSVSPADVNNCWAIADGATIYPSGIFSQGLRMVEDYKFGYSYLEFGSRLYWLGYKICFLSDTYVVHHIEDSDASGDSVWRGGMYTSLSSNFFAVLCYSFKYQPSFRNKLLTCLQIVKLLLTRATIAFPAFRKAVTTYRNHTGMQQELDSIRIHSSST